MARKRKSGKPEPKVNQEVVIGGERYRVIRMPDRLRDSNGLDCRYILDAEQRVLWLDSLLPDDSIAEVVAHAKSQPAPREVETIGEIELLDHNYQIVRSPEPLIDDDGKHLSAFIDHHKWVILISPEVSLARRQQIVLNAVAQTVRDLAVNSEDGDGNW